MQNAVITKVDSSLIVTKQLTDDLFQDVKYTLTDIYATKNMGKPTDADVLDFLNNNQDILLGILMWDEVDTVVNDNIYDKFF